MKTHNFQAMFATAALAALLVGCAATVRPTRPATEAPVNPAVSQLQTENELLRERLGSTEKRVESLKRELSAEQEKQRRFRESMTTNFDLLEQSVALSLAKTLKTRETVLPESAPVIPAPSVPSATPAPKAPEKARPVVIEKTALAAPVRAESKPVKVEPAPAPKPAVRETQGSVEPVSEATADEPLAGNFHDPDLSEPAEPRKLMAHPQAKPLYEKAFSHFARQEFDQSIVLFEDFLRRFPNDFYSDNAQFWVGEAHFRMGRMNQAELAYRNVLRNYEHRGTLEGYKTPDAIYRLGQAMMQRNEQRLARNYFEAAVARFPTSSAGRRAQQELTVPVAATASAARF